MNYSDYNDYELLDLAVEQNEDATNVIYKKYEPIIKNIASKYYNAVKSNGIELNDLIQEGMIGLSKAIDQYRDNKEASFYTFAITCIERRIYDLVNSSMRLKHKILNDSLPLETEDENGTKNLEAYVVDNNKNPENILFKLEEEKNFVNKTREILTDFECEVFSLKYNGFDYKEIAKILNKDVKAIDNALQRIKIKINKIIDKN